MGNSASVGNEEYALSSSIAKDSDITIPPPADVIGWAMVTIWIYLIPNLFAKYGEYILAIKCSTAWGTTPRRLTQANLNVKRSFIFHILLGLILYLGTGIAVSLLTEDMDRRATLISVGFSRLFAGVMFCVLSINIPQFFGLYHSRNIKKNKVSCRKSIKEIRFQFGWSLWKLMFSVIFYNGYFACRTRPQAVAYGLLIGFAFGSLLVYLIYAVRHNCSKKDKHIIAYILVGVLLFLSWIFIGYGTYWVSHVWWGDKNLGIYEIYIVGPVVAVWVIITLIIHGIFMRWTKKKELKGHSMRFTSKVFDRKSMIPSSLMPAAAPSPSPGNNNNNIAVVIDDEAETVDVEHLSATAAPEAPEVNDYTESNPNVVDGVVDVDVDDVDDDDDDSDDDSLDAGYDDGLVTERDILEGDSVPSYCTLFVWKLYEQFPCFFCCFKKYSIDRYNCPAEDDNGKIIRTAKIGAKIVDGLKYSLWWGFAFFFFALTIFNIGATHQQEAVRAQLDESFKVLYPPSFQNGTMCGWNKSTPNATITTFDTLQDLYDTNYSVVHCGACGACSNWNDLSIQYTKRKLLAIQGRTCALPSAFGASFSSLVDCTERKIGFTRPCGTVWAWDYLNTKKFCNWIFFQSIISNAVSDFSVSMEDVTSAGCDEAFSGPVFAPWAGAIRRRMNIKSAIERPKDQQCSVAKENWNELFGDPYNE